MKILITTDWYAPVINGVVTSVQNLTRQLKERGHEVKILTLSRSCHSYTEGDVFYVASIGVGCVYPQARLRLPLQQNYYIEEILAWKPDIVHSQCEFSTFALGKKIADELNLPIIHTYHTIYEDYTHYFSPTKKWGREIVQLITRRLSRQVDEMIAPSDKIKKILEGYQISCPVSVLSSGIDLQKYDRYRNPVWREKMLKAFSISADKTVLLFVGRLAKEKNIEELLQYQKEAQRYGSVLVIVGDGPYREALEAKTRKLKIEESVIFTGMVSQRQIAKYYQLGDLFVSASKSETQGITYAEALASGIPLLCRKDACLQNVIIEGKNGWQYENEAQFLEFLQNWGDRCEDEKRRTRFEAWQSAQVFSSQSFAERMEGIYEERSTKRVRAA